MEDLDAILESNRVNRSTLSRTTTESNRAEIAIKLSSGAWERLAPYIGISQQEVDDIKEAHRYQKPVNMRLAMMSRWHEIYGSKATYLKLVEGLSVGKFERRDLIEFIIQLVKKSNIGSDIPTLTDAFGLPSISDGPNLANETIKNSNPRKVFLPNTQTYGNKRFFDCIFILLFLSITSLFIITTSVVPLLSKLPTVRIENQDHGGTDTFVNDHPQIKTIVLDTSNKRKCEFNGLPNSDLPTVSQDVFVGREVDVHEVFNKLAMANIVNINGAPGFGKSALAIQVGYKAVKNGTSVRYINLEDKLTLFKFVTDTQKKTNSEFKPVRFPLSSVVEFHTSTIALPMNEPRLSNKNQLNYVEELQRWSTTIHCTTVLILDNCDDVLASSSRHEFINWVNSLVPKSHFNLHIIIVSREKLLFLNNFDCWTVRELNQSASIQLLDRLAPAVGNGHLREVAELVQGCPLALKVVGKLLHIHGSQLTYKLKNNLIRVLDKASVKKEKFQVLMDEAFIRLGGLKECGYSLSFFPGSFHKEAGMAVVMTSPEECLELYVKHSLVDEYFYANHYRYKMHRLIREYVKMHLSIDDQILFDDRFRKYLSEFVLIFAKKQELDYTEEHALLTEVHNLNYYKILLLNCKDLKVEELAALAFLISKGILQVEEVSMHYRNYLKHINDISHLIPLRVHGRLYVHIVKELYNECKCETMLEYAHNFVESPCIKDFPCEVVDQIKYLQQSGVLSLTQSENIFIDHVANHHCKLPIILLTIPFVLFSIKLFCNPKTLVLFVMVVLLLMYDVVSNVLYLQDLGLQWYKCISSGLALKWICHICVQISLACISIYIFKCTSDVVATNKQLPAISTIIFLTFYILLLFLLHYFGIFAKVSLYCCHFLPIC